MGGKIKSLCCHQISWSSTFEITISELFTQFFLMIKIVELVKILLKIVNEKNQGGNMNEMKFLLKIFVGFI